MLGPVSLQNMVDNIHLRLLMFISRISLGQITKVQERSIRRVRLSIRIIKGALSNNALTTHD